MNTLYMNFKKPYVSNTPLESFPWLRPALFFSSFWPLGHFHWRRFIGGREFVSHFIQTSFTLLEKHFKLKAISSKNQRTKRKDRAMKWIRYLWTIKTTRQQYSTSSRFRGYARPCFMFFFFFFDQFDFWLFTPQSKSARWSILFMPEQQSWKPIQNHFKKKTPSSEREIKKRKESNEMNKLLNNS